MCAGEVTLDGSAGEGGGQILRTALALSALTGRPLTIEKIRAGRKKPGLAAQHLAAVRAAREVCSAEVEGASQGSTTLRFRPGGLRPLKEHFEIGTAGSTGLVLQTVALPLALAEGESSISIGGGTHVPWSPPAEFVARHWAALLGRLGFKIKVRLVRAGYYPRGGGLLRAEIAGAARPSALRLDSSTGAPQDAELSGLVVMTRLDETIARRLVREAEHHLSRAGYDVPIDVKELPGPAPGIAFLLFVSPDRSGERSACFSSLGRRGKPAETVARECVRAALSYLEAGADFDPHTADQLVLPLSLAKGESRFTTSEVTRHLLTNLETVKAFLDVHYEVKGELGSKGEVRIAGAGSA